MKLNSKKVLCLATVLAVFISIFMPRSARAFDNAHVDCVNTKETVEVIDASKTMMSHVITKKMQFTTELNNAVNQTITDNPGSTYDLSVVDTLFSYDDDLGIGQYAKFVSFSKASDETYPVKGVLRYSIVRVTHNQLINEVSVAVKTPKAGDEITNTTEPDVVIPDGANYNVSYKQFITNYPSTGAGYDAPLTDTVFEAERDYYLEVFLEPAAGYEFNAIGDVTVTVNGGDDFELGYCSANQIAIYTKVTTAGENVEEPAKTAAKTYGVLEGANQKVVKGSSLKFRFDIEFAKFIDGGKVFVDGKLVDPNNYNTSEGSTVIEFSSEYTNTLDEGNHTVTVTVDDGEASTSFTLTDKSSSPKTGDNVQVFAGLMVIAILGCAIIIKKK